ncbi:hypothetical protein P43SY_011232 [Pythium insidiosum]|uniref:Tyr recombinase domain-containing protein n=1 Tax=Pythium insidiosum TaxID=114742 RepID=A0AAD5L7J3_PYTIN|nr:hypothetical protein P43SY_011232 [Pythium insidiosum]
MSLRDLAPKNTTKAKATAVNVFKRFLATEDVSLDYIHGCLSADTSGRLIEGIMDKFGLYLAFDAGKAGTPLARNTVAGYFRHVKLWLLDEHPQCRHLVEKKLVSMANTLEKHCMKREAGSYIKKAEACTKQHLKAMTMYLYSTASKAEDYQDLALLSLMWYLFGRASDLSMLRKPNLALSNDTSLFIKLIRVKTSEEQGLTIFPDADFTTCPITALAAALATQTVPAFALLSQLPAIAPTTIAELGPGTSLRDIIEADGHITTSVSRDGPQTKGNSPGIHNYVNRLLDRIATPAGVKVLLSSHSFRRGGAQHANGSADLSPQWIFDRGAWNMTSTNKAFAYVFNTTSEDQKYTHYN